jgi:hypothetical protein
LTGFLTHCLQCLLHPQITVEHIPGFLCKHRITICKKVPFTLLETMIWKKTLLKWEQTKSSKLSSTELDYCWYIRECLKFSLITFLCLQIRKKYNSYWTKLIQTFE